MVQGLFYFIFVSCVGCIKLYFKCLGIVEYVIVNGGIVMILNILLIQTVIKVFVLLKKTFLSDLLFYFSFVAWIFIDGYGTPTTARKTLILPRINSSVLITPSIIGAFCAAGLKNAIVNICKMVGLNVNVMRMPFEYSIFMQHVFKLLLFLQVISILMIVLIVNFLYAAEQLHQYIKTPQWHQLLLVTTTLCNFYLSCKDHFIFNCIRMFKIFLQHLQILKKAKMMVNGIIYIIHDILLMDNAINVFILYKHTFFNDLLFYFILIIFIFCSVSIIEAPYKNIHKNKNCVSNGQNTMLLYLDSIYDLFENDDEYCNIVIVFDRALVFLISIAVRRSDADNKAGNESIHFSVEFLNQVEIHDVILLECKKHGKKKEYKNTNQRNQTSKTKEKKKKQSSKKDKWRCNE